jgi:ribosome-binding factor A
MSKKPHRARDRAQPVIDANILFGDVPGRRDDRKERQLCRQVHEAISEALASLDDEVLSDVWVSGVEPAPDASRLAVLLCTPKEVSAELVKERLERVSGYLRTEVTGAITRKRAPTLTYEVLPPEVLE